jgi:hypothetical protein
MHMTPVARAAALKQQGMEVGSPWQTCQGLCFVGLGSWNVGSSCVIECGEAINQELNEFVEIW